VRTASIKGQIYPLRDIKDVLFAIERLDDASQGFKLSPSLWPHFRYRSEGDTRREVWQTPDELERSCVGDCEDLANYLVQLARQLGQMSHVEILTLPSYLHAVTWCDGRLFDACPLKGMPVDNEYAALVAARKIIFV